MTQMPSTLDELKRLRKEKPFKPFVVVTRHGENLVVTDPMHFGTNGTFLLVLDDQDRSTRLDISDVLKLREIDQLIEQDRT